VPKRLRTPKRKQKLTPEDYAKRFAAEKRLQQRRYCDAFRLWRACPLRSCRRHAACVGDAHRCLKRALDTASPSKTGVTGLWRVPRMVQWRVRQDILEATPANIGAPERAARQCMPLDFYVPEAR
jgi:hypothetical protein